MLVRVGSDILAARAHRFVSNPMMGIADDIEHEAVIPFTDQYFSLGNLWLFLLVIITDSTSCPG